MDYSERREWARKTKVDGPNRLIMGGSDRICVTSELGLRSVLNWAKSNYQIGVRSLPNKA